MVELKLRYFLTMIIFFYSCLHFAQFNTLTPKVATKTENTKVFDKAYKEEIVQNKNEKYNWIKILNITTKSDLKSEIDSLKTMMRDYRNENDLNKNELEKLRDSLLVLTRSRLQEAKQISKEQSFYEHYDFTEERKIPFSRIVMPLDNKLTVTSSYGTRSHPIFGTRKMHNGIDLKARYENVYSVMDGIVSATGWDSKGGGNYIKVKHFNRFETSYLHLSELYYRTGEKVKAGFIIGKSGNTGNSTGPHLHFSVKEFGESINPLNFLNDLIKANNIITAYNE